MREAKRSCARAQCRRQARIGGRYCRSCFAEANRRSHALHRRERNARRRGRSAQRDASARARDCARAKLYVAISRGKINKDACCVCGRDEVTALIADPARWWDVVWICREDRVERLASAAPAAKKHKAAPAKPARIGEIFGAWGTTMLQMYAHICEASFQMLAHSVQCAERVIYGAIALTSGKNAACME